MTAGCPRHRGFCAYTGSEPDRCPRCHRSWSVVTGKDRETRERHTADHDTADRHLAKKRDRRVTVPSRPADRPTPPPWGNYTGEAS
jgi:hypothetical protein